MNNMLKRIISIFLLLCLFPMHQCFASENININESLIYYPDGSYITITLTVVDSRASGTRIATKTYTYTAANGDEDWRADLTGTFTYTGTTAACTASSCTVTVTDTSWHEISKTVGRSGGTATADLTMGRKFLGITISKQTINMTLTCDANGNLT